MVSKTISGLEDVLLMPLAETIKEFVNFILKGVDLIDHTSICLLRTINHYVTFIMFYASGTLSHYTDSLLIFPLIFAKQRILKVGVHCFKIGSTISL